MLNDTETARRLVKIGAIRTLIDECYRNAKDHGFHNESDPRDPLILLALITSEVGEAVEAFRKPGFSDHIPPHSGAAEELADILIRVFDMAGEHDIDLASALVAKMEFNRGRSFRHGDKKY